MRRAAHQVHPAPAGQHARAPRRRHPRPSIVAENWSGPPRGSHSALDGRVRNAGVPRYRALRGDHLAAVGTGRVDPDIQWLEVETRGSRIRIARGRADPGVPRWRTGTRRAADRSMSRGASADALHVDVEAGVPVTIEKIVTLFTSRDAAIYEPAIQAGCRFGARRRFRRGCSRPIVQDWARLWSGSTSDRGAATIAGDHPPPRVPRPPDRVREHDRARRGGSGPRAPRRGLPWARLLGRGVHLPVPEPPSADPRPDASRVPVPASPEARGAAAQAGYRGRDVPMAERERRQGGDPGRAPQPAVRPMAPGPLAPPTAHQHRHRVQRVASLAGRRRRSVPPVPGRLR